MTRFEGLLTQDRHDQSLLDQVHPTDWVNPLPQSRYNLVVIGGGTAGLVTAAGAAGLGARVALVERHLMGGDCLNFGCVPSKALIRSSRGVADARSAGKLGVRRTEAAVADFPAVMERLRSIRAGISRHDSVHRFSELGVDVFLGEGRFAGPDRIEVGDQILRFSKAVIATGARASVPPIPGLVEAGYLTNETIFSLTELPARLAIVGGGPIGCELAQAFSRLGSKVTLIELEKRFLPREDPEAAELLKTVFVEEEIDLRLNTRLSRVENSASEKRLVLESDGNVDSLDVDQILIGTGRSPNVAGLNLERAGVHYSTSGGIEVDDHLRTTNRRIFAAGDVVMQHQFTHAADASARIVIQNALFLGRKKASRLVIPWCTYTSPEIAHVGLSESESRVRGIEIRTFKTKLSSVDRAVLDGEERGFVKIHVGKRSDQILGATIVATSAGDMISEVTLAIVGEIGLGSLASVIHPYPTQSEAIRRTADAYNRTRLTPTVKALFERWLKWTR
ncbi:MAG: mercuric reductase [Acidobacteriota bacterium]|nr:MAG: mercuric reductase [Acidobacteriota bacterium]